MNPLQRVRARFVAGRVHYQNLDKELARLRATLNKHRVQVRSALDLGCGNGSVTTRLRAMLGLERIYGVDVDRRVLRQATARGVLALCADMRTVQLARTFDAVICYGALHHTADAPALARTMARLTHRYVIIVDNTVRDGWFHRFTGSKYFPLEASPFRIRSLEEIVESLAKAGCTVLAADEQANANVWHDRTICLAVRDGARALRVRRPR